MTRPACQPFDSSPRPPREALPAGGCDCHAHVFGPFDHHPLVARRRYTPPEATADAYLAMLDAVGLERGVLVQPSVHGFDHGAMIDAIRAHPARLCGVAHLDWSQGAETEIRRLDEAGFCGARVNMGAAARPDGNTLLAISEHLREAGWHLDLQVASIDQMVELSPLLRRMRLPVVIEAMGKMRGHIAATNEGFQALRALLRDGAAWVKLSHAYKLAEGPDYADTLWVARDLVRAAPSQILWGSDWPHPNVAGPMPNDGDLLDLFNRWVEDDADRQAVLVDNPRRFYRFNGVSGRM